LAQWSRHTDTCAVGQSHAADHQVEMFIRALPAYVKCTRACCTSAARRPRPSRKARLLQPRDLLLEAHELPLVELACLVREHVLMPLKLCSLIRWFVIARYPHRVTVLDTRVVSFSLSIHLIIMLLVASFMLPAQEARSTNFLAENKIANTYSSKSLVVLLLKITRCRWWRPAWVSERSAAEATRAGERAAEEAGGGARPRDRVMKRSPQKM